jgi:cyclase
MYKSIRVIARLDLKSQRLIKGINFEGMRDLGNADAYAKKYFLDGADELIVMDSVASLFSNNTAINFLNSAIKKIFIPITIGGGIKNIDEVRNVLKNGADKVAINSGIVRDKKLIKKIAHTFGSQSLVVSINAKKKSKNSWELYIDRGREKTNIDVFEWANFVQKNGAGEILLTAIDKDGTELGFDYELAKKMSRLITIPLIIAGGCGNLDDIEKVIKFSKVTALALSTILHYKKFKIQDIKNFLDNRKFNVRK